jgi:hypothetical protein
VSSDTLLGPNIYGNAKWKTRGKVTQDIEMRYMLGYLDALAPFITVHAGPYPRVDMLGPSIERLFREDSAASWIGVSGMWSRCAGVSEHVCPIGEVSDAYSIQWSLILWSEFAMSGAFPCVMR